MMLEPLLLSVLLVTGVLPYGLGLSSQFYIGADSSRVKITHFLSVRSGMWSVPFVLP